MKNIKMHQDGDWNYIQEDRVNRFLEEGWSLQKPKSEKKSPAKTSKNKITADAQVTSKPVEAEVHVHDENCGHDWDPSSGEDWVDSEESVINETAKQED